MERNGERYTFEKETFTDEELWGFAAVLLLLVAFIVGFVSFMFAMDNDSLFQSYRNNEVRYELWANVPTASMNSRGIEQLAYRIREYRSERKALDSQAQRLYPHLGTSTSSLKYDKDLVESIKTSDKELSSYVQGYGDSYSSELNTDIAKFVEAGDLTVSKPRPPRKFIGYWPIFLITFKIMGGLVLLFFFGCCWQILIYLALRAYDGAAIAARFGFTLLHAMFSRNYRIVLKHNSEIRRLKNRLAVHRRDLADISDRNSESATVLRETIKALEEAIATLNSQSYTPQTNPVIKRARESQAIASSITDDANSRKELEESLRQQL